ncbi:MAG: BlaI/MecI/CopY family transcriptional regulator [Chitinivibrionales bacterium]|nr:BlaI/MecI/CopY family transcriptional regulator [Chitinivibrionales bacterium]
MDDNLQEKISLSRTEWIVMNAIWRMCGEKGNATVAEILEQVHSKLRWNTSTLKTILERLVKKGVLQSTLRGRTCFYIPVGDRNNIVTTNLTQFLDTVLEGALGPLVAYLADRKGLTPKQAHELEALLAASKINHKKVRGL